MGSRGGKDQVNTKRDLLDEPDINEAEEKEFGKEVKRDANGNPIVEDNPSATS